MSALIVPIVIYLIICFVPGYFVGRCFGLSSTKSLCGAPVLSISLICILGEIYAAIGIMSTPITILTPAIGVPAILYAALRTRKVIPVPRVSSALSWAIIAFVIVLGAYVAYSLVLSRIGGSDAFYQSYDVTRHLNAIQAFADSGHFSSIGTSYYMTEADQAIAPWSYASFYPSAWHITCALLIQATGVTVPQAINASIFVICGIVFPLGMALLFNHLFPHQRRKLFFGAFISVSFVAFPWIFLTFGPLYANLAGFALVPIVCTFFMRIFEGDPDADSAYKQHVILSVLLVLISIIGLALLHPNSVFSCAVLLILFCIKQVAEFCRVKELSGAKTTIAVLAFFIFCVVAWYACFRLPLFQDVVSEYWPSFAMAWQEIVNIFTQTYTFYFVEEIAVQIPLAIFVIIGIVTCLYARQYRYLVGSYALACLICFVCAVDFGEKLAQLFGGFWYCDGVRLAATAVIAAMPLAVVGCDWLYNAILNVVKKYNVARNKQTHPRLVAATLAIACFLCAFVPGFDLPGLHQDFSKEEWSEAKENHAESGLRTVHTSFGDFRTILESHYLGIQEPLEDAEKAFLYQVKDIVGDSLVINNPMDGSFLAYGYNGLRVYYRDFTKVTGEGYDSETSQIIRTDLANIATNDSVKAAVEETGAEYVLVMSEVRSIESFVNLRDTYDPECTSGISSITPDTPGFEVVASAEASEGVTLYLYKTTE